MTGVIVLAALAAALIGGIALIVWILVRAWRTSQPVAVVVIDSREARYYRGEP